MHQSREAHHPARPLYSPRLPCTCRRSEPGPSGGSHGSPQEQGIATEQARPRAQATDLQVCAPGRTRTCTLRIISRPTAVHGVARGGVVAAQVRSVVRLMRPRSAVCAWRNDQRNDRHRASKDPKTPFLDAVVTSSGDVSRSNTVRRPDGTTGVISGVATGRAQSGGPGALGARCRSGLVETQGRSVAAWPESTHPRASAHTRATARERHRAEGLACLSRTVAARGRKGAR